MTKVLIIGAGASGLACSITAAVNNEVTLLEKNDICGKKILVTGNGRCNYFNDNFTSRHYHSSSFKNLHEIINDSSKKEVLYFFDKLGIIPKKKNGYYYPMSNEAKSIRNILEIEAKNRGVNIITGEEVKNITYLDNKYIINTNKNEYITEKLVISTGGCSQPKTGSDGKVLKLVEKLGHTIIKPLPSLVQLVGEASYLKKWKGIRSEVSLRLYENNLFIKQEAGEIQLTDYGISGICTMQLSSYISRGLDDKNNENVIINFVPFLRNKDDFIKYLDDRYKKLSRNISDLLEGIVNSKLIKVLLEITDTDKSDDWDKLNSNKKEEIAKVFTEFNFKVVGTKSFNEAQTTSGGISLKEVNLETMESKIFKGLYFTGEVLDIDGECGGYNLGFAWLSGIKAGKNI